LISETALLIIVVLAVANMALLFRALHATNTQASAATGLAANLEARFDGLYRDGEAVRRSLTEMDQGLRREIASSTREGFTAAFDRVQEGTKAQADGLVNVQNALNQLGNTIRNGFDGFSNRLGQDQELLRQNVEAKLEQIRTGNEAKLEQMRVTVDEKLQATLEQRLGASFKQVSDSLEQVYKSVGEMQALAVGVGDLKRVLSNIKARGVLTETLAENMLAEVLAPEQYSRNVEIRPGSGERVEFAIRLPGDETAPVWLPIDVKFPMVDYERLGLAVERGDQVEAERASRAIEVVIRQAARDIYAKYLHPPHSTDFGVMYLPTEGLFAEVVRRPGLMDSIQREYHVMVAGPTTLFTLLTSMRMGFRSLAIQKRSAEVWKVLGAVKSEFSKFGGVMDKVSKKLDEAQRVIDDEVGRRRRAMERHLRAVEALPEGEAAALLAYDDQNEPVHDDDPEAIPAAAQ